MSTTLVNIIVDALNKKPEELAHDMFETFNHPSEELKESCYKGFEMATIVTVATLLLEIYSFDTAKIILAKNKVLYFQAVALNFINHYFYGIPVYICAAAFTRPVDAQYSFQFLALQVLLIMVVHSITYYQMHKTFHTIPGLYKHHKFHHRFHTHVTPMVAHAVSFVEYFLAYVVAFAVAAIIVRPYGDALRFTIYFTAMTNLSIHTPKIEAWSERNMPAWWVSTHNHMEHHSKLTVHYGAPTFNVDWVVEKLAGVTGSVKASSRNMRE